MGEQTKPLIYGSISHLWKMGPKKFNFPLIWGFILIGRFIYFDWSFFFKRIEPG